MELLALFCIPQKHDEKGPGGNLGMKEIQTAQR